MGLPADLVIAPAAWTAQPWKNGGGVTHEIWRWSEAGAEAFDLRLSVAQIVGAQLFSAFPGVWRALIPLDPSDLVLVADGAELPLVSGAAVQFSGDAPAATRGTGTTRDLNVMSRSARRRARVEIGARSAPASEPGLAVFALAPVTVHARGAARPLALHETWIGAASGAAEASAPVVWIWF